MKTLDHARTHDSSRDDIVTPARDEAPRKIFRKANATGEPAAVANAATSWSFGDAINAGVHGGNAIPDPLRTKFEASLGTDLSGVRVHDGADAARASASVGARAFAVGQDVYMGAGQYAPHTDDGAHLLAHEVAHTVQQRGATTGPQMKLEVSEAGDTCEREADAAASAMVAGTHTTVNAADAQVARTPEHGAAAHAPALTPAQQHALTTVQREHAALRRRSENQLLELARTLGAAWNTSQPHTEQRRTLAAALVHLYDAFDDQLGDKWLQGDATPQMAWEFPEFSMIDPWIQDAHEPSQARHRPHRRTQPRPPVQPPGNTPAPPVQTATPAPHADLDQLARGTQGPEMPQQGFPLGDVGGTAVEGATHGLELILAEGSLGGALAGFLAPFASLAAALLTIHAGDEFNHHMEEGQTRMFNFCAAFAHVVRGEGAGGGEGASDGAAGGRRTLELAAAQHLDLNALRHRSFFSLYAACWHAVEPHVSDMLQRSISPTFWGSTESSRAMVEAAMIATRAGGPFYQAHGGD